MNSWPGFSSVIIVFLISTQGVLAEEIPEAYVKIAQYYRVPPDILFAIALQESGYQFQSRFRAWPWTLNISGKGYRFTTRQQTYQRLAQAIKDGLSVDGCIMQINWRWHSHRFKDLWSLLDPHTCVNKGAEILMELYKQSQDWWIAVGRYHAPGLDKKSVLRANKYRTQVKKRWKKLLIVNQGHKETTFRG